MRPNIRLLLTQLCKDLGLQVGGTNRDRLDRVYNHLYDNEYHVLVDKKDQEMKDDWEIWMRPYIYCPKCQRSWLKDNDSSCECGEE